MDNIKNLKAITKGAGIILIGMLISKVFAYAYRVILAKYLGPADYGTFSLGLALVGLLTIFALAGFPQGILRFVSYYKGKKDKAGINAIISLSLKITLISGIAMAILFALFANQISIGLFHNLELSKIMYLLAAAIPLGVLVGNLEMITQAFQAVKYIVIARNIIEILSKVLITAALLLLGFGLAGSAIAYAASLVISSVLLFYFLQKKVYAFKIMPDTSRYHLKQMINFSLPLLMYDFMLVSILQLDTLILGYYKPSSVVGIYNAVTPTARLVHILPIALQTLFYPVICSLYARKEPISGIYKSITKWMVFLSLPITLIIAIYSREALTILFGAEYSAGAFALIIATIGYFVYALSFTAINVLGMLKKTKHIFVNKLIAVSANIILNIALIPNYGLNGAALALAAAFIIETLLIHIEAYYFTKITPFKLSYFSAILAAAIASAALFALNKIYEFSSTYSIILTSAGFIAVYGILLFILPKAVEDEDKEIIKSILLKVKNSLRF
ncbi:MAG: oligosaccharide flippase family protein [Candidatus Nanoarchaeia archaeon]|nr:oligosaccharide flippase family protein [Candidatus Nanoarchaeia archaeon]